MNPAQEVKSGCLHPFVRACACGCGPSPTHETDTHCWWCGKKLISSSNPSVQAGNRVRDERKGGTETMVSIHDLITLGVLDENHRCVEPSCPFYELPRFEKALTCLSAFEACEVCAQALNVSRHDPLYALTRHWLEQCEVTRNLVELPTEIMDRLNRMTVEIVTPDGAFRNIVEIAERPSITPNQRPKPDFKYLIRHLWEKCSCIFRCRIKHGEDVSYCPNIKDHTQIRLHVSIIIGHKNVGILRTWVGTAVALHSYAVFRQQKCWVKRK